MKCKHADSKPKIDHSTGSVGKFPALPARPTAHYRGVSV